MLARQGIVTAGVPIDWNAMVMTNYDRIDQELAGGGRHYGKVPSLALVNIVLSMIRGEMEGRLS